MATYTTLQGDILDAIVTARYGDIDGALEAVLAVNPSLLAYGPILPPGLTVILPDADGAASSQSEVINLWD